MASSYRDSNWDEADRQSEQRYYSVKRYVIPSEQSSMYRRDGPAMSERELTIRPHHDRDDRYNYEYRREKDYDQVYRASSHAPSHHESDYQLVSRPDTDERWALRSPRDPRDDDYYYSRSTREYDDGRHHYDEYEERYYAGDSPRSSGSHRTRSRRSRNCNSDDDMVYSRRGRYYRDESPHHYKRHLAEGALVGVGAAELVRHRSKKRDGEEESSALSRIGTDVGAGALGAVAADVLQRARSRHRSKSRRRAESLDRGRDHNREHRHRHRRHRSRSSPDSRVKTLAGLGLGAAAIAGAVALARKKSQRSEKAGNSNHGRRSRSRRRRGSESGSDNGRNPAHRNKRMAEAGLAGAAVAGLIERARSKSRSRKGERSRSRIRQGLPIAAASLGSAAIAGLYEKHKEKKENESSERHHRHRSRSRSVAPSSAYSDPSGSAPQLIEYGDDPVYGSIPTNHYYGRPSTRQSSPRAIESSFRRRSRHRSVSRSHSRNQHRYRDGGSGSNSSFSDHDGGRKHRSSRHKERSRSRTRDLATAGLAAAGAGLAAREYTQRQERKKAEKGRRKYARDHDYTDSYEEGYDPVPHVPSPPPNGANYYPHSNYFPPPPGSTPVPPNHQGGPYNPADYPPSPGAPPMTQANYSYPPPPPPPAADPYSPRSINGEENVSAVPTPNPTLSHEQRHMLSEGIMATASRQLLLPSTHPVSGAGAQSATTLGYSASPFAPTPPPLSTSPQPIPTSRNLFNTFSRPRSSSQSASIPAKSVQFDLRPHYASSPSTDRRARIPTGENQGYETDDSDSTMDGLGRSRLRFHSRPHHRLRTHTSYHPHQSTASPASIPFPPTPSFPRTTSATPQHSSDKTHTRVHNNNLDVESDSTIELSDRFDALGHRLLVPWR
ncbi:hypothetical protein ACO22_01664 [Paracoccidioides brasiliensis]|uniref:DUF3824 domain-containing protein n=1 Tax=Paracoccidioides brasiliensis TaxID=121759 RepID=A0A1D2JKW6_PARBR|nr:hypothetical protein ACO22_01664 [Paracoccidioides brasiliensis]